MRQEANPTSRVNLKPFTAHPVHWATEANHKTDNQTGKPPQTLSKRNEPVQGHLEKDRQVGLGQEPPRLPGQGYPKE